MGVWHGAFVFCCAVGGFLHWGVLWLRCCGPHCASDGAFGAAVLQRVLVAGDHVGWLGGEQCGGWVNVVQVMCVLRFFGVLVGCCGVEWWGAGERSLVILVVEFAPFLA